MAVVQQTGFNDYNLERRFPQHHLILSGDRFEEMIRFLESSPVLVFDTETSGLDYFRDSRACGIALAGINGQAHYFYVPFRHHTGEAQLDLARIGPAIKRLLASSQLKIGHHIKFDDHMIRREGWQLEGERYDTLIAAKLADENRPVGLKYRAAYDLGIAEAVEEEKRVGDWVKALAKAAHMGVEKYRALWGYSQVPIWLLGLYACRDVQYTFGLHQFYEKLGLSRQFPRIWKTEMELVSVLCDMEEQGIAIDVEYLSRLRNALRQVLERKEEEIANALGGKRLALGSDDVIRRFLMEELRCPLTKMTRGGAKGQKKHAVDREVLETFSYAHPAVPLILEWREAEKLYNTYTQSILDRLDKNNVLHPEFNQVGTTSGRLCVAGDTILDTSIGSLCISDLDLHNNQNVLITTHRGRLRPILAKYYKGREQMYRVILDDGSTITCTAGHRFLTPGGWRSLREVACGGEVCGAGVPGDSISAGRGLTRSIDGGESYSVRKIVGVEPAGIQDVWDIEVREDHSYLAAGFINHNSCSRPNFQNQPVDDDARAQKFSGKKLEEGGVDPWSIRRAYIVGKPGWARLLFDYCLAPETLVETVAGKRALGNLQAGDKVYTYRDGKIAWGEVTRSARVGRLPSYRVTFDNGESAVASADHRWPIRVRMPGKGGPLAEEIRTTSELQIGDRMIPLKRVHHRVVAIEFLGDREMAAITVEPDHNFVLGCGVVTCNSQIELRVLSHYSRDPILVDAYLRGEDIHTRTSREVFGSEEKSKRRMAKVINFGLAYGLSPKGFSRQVGVPKEEAEQHFQKFFERYRGIVAFRENFWNQVRGQGGSFQNLFGRPRRIHGLDAPDNFVRGKAEREAIASLIQGTAAELTKESLVRVARFFKEEKLPAQLVSTVHDEIQLDCAAEVLPEVVRGVRQRMVDFPEFSPIPIVVDGDYTVSSWASKQKLPKE